MPATATATGSGSLAVTSDHTVPVAGMARSYMNEQPFVAAGRLPPNQSAPAHESNRHQ